MKRFIPLFILLSLAAVTAGAQVRLPRPSQKATVLQTLGVTDVSITYSRPPVKGRTIWGDAPETMAARAKGEATLDNQNDRKPGEPIVPWGHVWRAGANEATLFVVTDDVLINGQPLPAGRYSFHTIPAKDGEWTLIFNKDDGQWGSFTYDSSKDALRVKTKTEMAPDNQELLTYMIEPTTDTAARVVLRWEKVRVPFTIEVKDVVAATLAHAREAIPSVKPDDFATFFSAANYALKNKDADDATKWYTLSLAAADAQIKTKETYDGLRFRFNALLALGRKDEALAAGDAAVARGKADKANTTALEKRLADIRAGK